MGKKAPAAPDPYKTAAAQGGMNMDTAITQQFLNGGTQVNPWGTVNTEVTGNNTFVDSQGKTITVPKFTQTTTLSPEQQAIFNQSQAAEGNLAGIANEQSAFLKDYLNGRLTWRRRAFAKAKCRPRTPCGPRWQTRASAKGLRHGMRKCPA